MLLNWKYSFEELEGMATRGFTKPYKVRGSLTNHYPMSDRGRNYYYFVPFYDANLKVFKIQIYIHGKKIYSIDSDNIITWQLDDGDWDSGITRILNKDMHDERGLVRHDSAKGGLCFVIYKTEDNPRYKDYMGNILDQYAHEKIWKIKEVFPLKPNMQYKLVKFTPEGSNCYHVNDTLESISKYDVVARKLNTKKAREIKHNCKSESEEFSSILLLLDDSESKEKLYNSFIDNVLGDLRERSKLDIRAMTTEQKQVYIDKAGKHSISNKIFIRSFLHHPLSKQGVQSLARWGEFEKDIWDENLKALYESEDCYDKKYYSCEDKYYPSNKNIKIQRRDKNA
tara:strand:- start:207 stop:1226 length:1020 start_codon:yes stop_codon:yes gene_type:complete